LGRPQSAKKIKKIVEKKKQKTRKENVCKNTKHKIEKEEASLPKEINTKRGGPSLFRRKMLFYAAEQTSFKFKLIKHKIK